MMTMRELFYGENEQLWILKGKKNKNEKNEGDETSGDNEGGEGSSKKEKKNNKNNDSGNGRRTHPFDLVISNLPFYPCAECISEEPKDKKDNENDKKKEKEVVMRVSMCCGLCADEIKGALEELAGVKSVKCEWYKKKVTVLGTATPLDLLLVCKSYFRSSMWDD